MVDRRILGRICYSGILIGLFVLRIEDDFYTQTRA